MSGDREKLVELLRQCVMQNITTDPDRWDAIIAVDYDSMADHLLAGGVIILPCKVGDWVWRLSTKHISKVKYIESTKISRIAVDANAVWLFCECNPISRCTFGKTVFLTREDAEAALKERAAGGVGPYECGEENGNEKRSD